MANADMKAKRRVVSSIEKPARRSPTDRLASV